MTQDRLLSRRKVLAGITAAVLSPLGLPAATAVAQDQKKEAAREIKVHIYPYELNGGDKLSDGSEKLFEIKEQTLLVWVDLKPGYYYAHPTSYVLISASGTRVEKGEWWPVLNGNRLPLLGGSNQVAVMPPVVLERKEEDKQMLPRRAGDRQINLFPYPYTMSPGDKLVDGPLGGAKSFDIKEQTLLVWVDLLPEAYFAHPTSYVLISASGTRVEKGEWWPVLNENALLRNRNKALLVSPMTLSKP